MEGNGKTNWMETEAGHQLQERLNSERTLRALDHLLERIDTLEQAVDRLSVLMNQGPGLVSMATDMVDETVKKARSNGVDLDQRLSNAIHMAEKLTAPETVEKVDKLLETAEQVPMLLSIAADSVDEEIRKASDRGVSVDKRLGTALRMAEKITDPAMEGRLNQLIDISNQMPGLVAMTIDILDEGYRKAVREGLDLETLTKQGTFALKQLSTVLASTEFEALMSSGILSPSTLGVVAQAGEALTESQSETPKKVGLFGTMGALRDPDRKRALGFIMTFMKNFGKKLG